MTLRQGALSVPSFVGRDGFLAGNILLLIYWLALGKEWRCEALGEPGHPSASRRVASLS